MPSLDRMLSIPVRYLLSLLVLLQLGGEARAQLPARLSDEAELSLLTIAPGDELHTLFGHGAIRVVDPLQDFDASFNYGTFEFGEGFVQKFMVGELDYFLSVYPNEGTLEQAVSKRRSVVEQVFALSAEERQALYDALVLNAQPENCTYRYDFLFDNCSTRIIDMLEDTLGPELVMPDGPYEPRSFRTLLDEHVGAMPWLRFGFALLLGATVDETASYRDSWFLPRHLEAAIDDATLGGEPLVAEKRVLYDSGLPTVPARTFDLPTALCWALLALAGVLVIRDERGLLSRLADALLFAVVGAAGLFMLVMWLATLHHVTSANWNLAWALPTHLVAALFLLRSARPSWLRAYLGLTAVVAFVVALGFGIPQALSPAILPLALLIALRAAVNARPWPRAPRAAT